MKEKNCENCHLKFTPKRKTARFCSSNCRAEYHNTKKLAVSGERKSLIERVNKLIDILESKGISIDAENVAEVPKFSSEYSRLQHDINNIKTLEEVEHYEKVVSEKRPPVLEWRQYSILFDMVKDKKKQLSK